LISVTGSLLIIVCWAVHTVCLFVTRSTISTRTFCTGTILNVYLHSAACL